MFRHMVLPLAAGAVLLATGSAAAQDSAPPFRPRSERVAFTASLLSTVLPAALALQMHSHPEAQGWLLAYATFLGPSAGYFYAGKPGRAFTGLGLRLGITVAAVVGAYATCGWTCTGNSASDTILYIGIGALAASLIYDIAKSGQAARDWNQEHEPAVSVVPRVNPVTRSAGLAVWLTF